MPGTGTATYNGSMVLADGTDGGLIGSLALDADFDDIVLTEEGLEIASYEVSDLLSSTSYFWRITNVSVCGDSEPSNVFEFLTVQCAAREYTGSTTNIPENSP